MNQPTQPQPADDAAPPSPPSSPSFVALHAESVWQVLREHPRALRQARKIVAAGQHLEMRVEADARTIFELNLALEAVDPNCDIVFAAAK